MGSTNDKATLEISGIDSICTKLPPTLNITYLEPVDIYEALKQRFNKRNPSCDPDIHLLAMKQFAEFAGF